jgi:hypothetical protein
MAIIGLAVLVCYILAWVWTTQISIEAAQAKGYDHLNGQLWFIGLFGGVFTPAIIAAALPDKKGRSAESIQREAENDVAGELPSL